eukprot:CAMPEP_0172446212 /NCGR_PEP_ID=MMETSP1065-20121228/5855_1 /TAXON_ID=265537 /ORGANISM="Amphiprora paludosa, Strain CCMP125" /LENGTH=462 /DNA_ID=CAMNT_0013197271 /DNA_START=179 /DNA_END=1567 /DNA_ORIENTATION=-
MEAELLRDMIADRDRRIALVKQKTADLDSKEQRLLDDLDAATESSARENIAYESERNRMVQHNTQANEQLAAMQLDLQNQASSLATYANLVIDTGNGTAPLHVQGNSENTLDSNYVMRMQAQLCKAMHSMGILDHQLTVAKEAAEAMLKLQRDVLAEQREAKAQLELNLLNELMKADTERRETEAQIKKEHDAVRRQVKNMEREVRQNQPDEDDESQQDGEKEEDDEEEEEEEDEETQNAKQEMIQLLEQRKQQIKEIEAKLDEQEKYLNKLRDEQGQKIQVEQRPAPTRKEEESNHAAEGEEEEEEALSSDEEDEEEQQASMERQAMDERLKQLTENAKLDDVDENVDDMDLLAMAQSRLAGGDGTNHSDDDEDDDEEDSDEDEEDSEDEEEDEDDEQINEKPHEEEDTTTPAVDDTEEEEEEAPEEAPAMTDEPAGAMEKEEKEDPATPEELEKDAENGE